LEEWGNYRVGNNAFIKRLPIRKEKAGSRFTIRLLRDLFCQVLIKPASEDEATPQQHGPDRRIWRCLLPLPDQ
jgi:hypothetical protein